MIPLFTSKQVRSADKYAIAKLGIPGAVLMENAASNIFKEIYDNFTDLLPLQMPVGIICGKGNNGGDGFAAARHFINNGFKVIVISIGKPNELSGDARLNYSALKNLIAVKPGSKLIIYKSINDLSNFKNVSIIVDAILGTGAAGELRKPYSEIVEKLNSFNTLKAAIDIPTGLNVDDASGSLIFNADLTVTLAEFKRGLFFGKGYKYSGNVVKGNIGIGGEHFDSLPVEDFLIEPEDAFEGIPTREIDAQKYSAGKVFTIAGSGNFPGAPVFTSNSVLIGGAGASILALPDSLKKHFFSKLNGSTIAGYNDDHKGFLSVENLAELEDKFIWADSVVIGPGLGREETTQKCIIELLRKRSRNVVIDADAVYALSGGKYKKLNLKSSVFTPHHKEFADLIGISIGELENDLLGYGKKFVKSTGAFLVLKGAPTVILNPSNEAFINSAGNPGMAKFGVGDVLSGLIGGFIAQTDEIESSLISAVYLHSLSADILLENGTELSLTAEEIMKNFPNAVRFLHDSII